MDCGIGLATSFIPGGKIISAGAKIATRAGEAVVKAAPAAVKATKTAATAAGKAIADGARAAADAARKYGAKAKAYMAPDDGNITLGGGHASLDIPALPTQLRGGPANNTVYQGTAGDEAVYSGITNNFPRRKGQHGGRFDEIVPLNDGDLERGAARAIEQALIVRDKGQNIINSISPKHDYYEDAVNWGEGWLRQRGY